jgi:hypothetical protein
VASYRLLLKASAAKEIEKVGTKSDRRRIIENIRGLSQDPRGLGTERLAGYEDRCRVRQGTTALCI